MTIFLIILFALWVYPLISFIVIRQTRNKQKLRKWILYVSFTLTGLTLLGLLTGVSTTSSIFDWLMVSNIYLSITHVLCWALFESNKLLNIVSFIAITCIYGVGFTYGSAGAVVIGFVISDYETKKEEWFDGGIIYKEFLVGNVIAQVRGRRVEIYKTLSWLPIIEWRKQKKEYFNFVTVFHEFTINYEPNKQIIYLSIGEKCLDSLILR